MTIIEAIQAIDSQKPNNYSEVEKIKWLSKLDGIIKKEIIDTHENGESIEFTGYDENTPIDTEMLVSSPYEDVYIYWLESRIDYANAEYAKYNNSTTMFNTAYASFANAYNRDHMPKGTHIKYF